MNLLETKVTLIYSKWVVGIGVQGELKPMSTVVQLQNKQATDTNTLPPKWLLISLGAGYLISMAVILFFPGATLIDRLRALDGGICAQLPTHTFYPGGDRLPLCARNTGIYLGFSLGLLLTWGRGRWRVAGLPTGWVAALLLGGIALMGIDGVNSLFLDMHLPHLYQPNNMLRLATGLLTGTAMVSFLVPVVNSILWKRVDTRTIYPRLRTLGLIVPVLLLAFLAVISGFGFLLYPLAIISSVGVVLALSFINLTFIVAFTGKAERYEHVLQAFPVFTLAIVLAITELVVLFNVNHMLLQKIGA